LQSEMAVLLSCRPFCDIRGKL